MRTLLSILDTGRSSLLAHQAAISTASNNSANVNVEGYSKRDVSFRSIGQHSGVGVESVRRRANIWLDRRVMMERTRLGTRQSQAEGMAGVEAQFGSFEGGLGGMLDDFFASVRGLSTAPTDPQARAAALAAGQTLADGFASTAAGLKRQRSQTDGVLRHAADDATALASDIAALSGQITRSEASGGEASDARDRRDVLVAALAELVEINPITNDDGTYSVFLSNGLPLVQGDRSFTLQATPDGALGGLSRIDYVDDTGVATDLTADLRQGRIGGLLTLRDDALADLTDRLDQLAFDFATAFNGIHAAGFGVDGGTGRNFFAAPGAVAGAARGLALEAGLADNPDRIAASTTAAGAVGENDNLLALTALSSTEIAGGGSRTPAEEIAEFVGFIGRETAGHRSGAEQAEVALATTTAMKDSSTAVSIDEELIDITRFERAYQAGARIITTVDRMFETILQL